MEKIDYIIVGAGYAGTFLAHHMLEKGISFRLFSDGKQGASAVSAGMVNPAVLKKFTTFWLAQQQIDLLHKSCEEIQNYTGKNYLIDEQVHRIFHDENEKNLWLKKSVNEDLVPFLSADFKEFDVVRNPFGSGEVMQSCRLNVANFFSDIHTHFKNKGYLIEEAFEYSLIDVDNSSYKGFHFKKIIFCEGMGVLNNPFFSNIDVNPNKGHHLKVRLDSQLPFQATLKKKHFLFPLSDDLYYYGGTYDRDHLDDGIDEAAVEQLKNGLSEFYPLDFTVEEIKTGFRPTVKDRRPIIGSHAEYPNLIVFNGLGARGVLNGNYFAMHLVDHLESGIPLNAEISLQRFS